MPGTSCSRRLTRLGRGSWNFFLIDTLRPVEHDDARQHHCPSVSVNKQTPGPGQVPPANQTNFANLLLDVAWEHQEVYSCYACQMTFCLVSVPANVHVVKNSAFDAATMPPLSQRNFAWQVSSKIESSVFGRSSYSVRRKS